MTDHSPTYGQDFAICGICNDCRAVEVMSLCPGTSEALRRLASECEGFAIELLPVAEAQRAFGECRCASRSEREEL